MVICDDFDLPLGSIRLRDRGGPGTHNGMKSIINEIGPNFVRLRVGIGPLPTAQDVSSFVLNRFNVDDIEILKRVLIKVNHTAIQWLTEPFSTVQKFANTK